MIKNSQAQLPRGRKRETIFSAGMIKRLGAPTVALLACLALGACSSFSGFVSDHWPTWAGGMPKDVPPRPGAPGYEEFIAHQQAQQAPAPAATSTVAPGAAPAAPQAMPVAVTAPVSGDSNVPVNPAAARQPDDQGAVRGGLY